MLDIVWKCNGKFKDTFEFIFFSKNIVSVTDIKYKYRDSILKGTYLLFF